MVWAHLKKEVEASLQMTNSTVRTNYQSSWSKLSNLIPSLVPAVPKPTFTGELVHPSIKLTLCQKDLT